MHVPVTLSIAPSSDKETKSKHKGLGNGMNTTVGTKKRSAVSGNIGASMNQADIERFIMLVYRRGDVSDYAR